MCDIRLVSSLSCLDSSLTEYSKYIFLQIGSEYALKCSTMLTFYTNHTHFFEIADS